MTLPKNDIISDDELIEMTGYKFPSKQCAALQRAGISFVKRRDGRPRVTWTHVNAALSGAKYVAPPAEEQPNFDAI